MSPIRQTPAGNLPFEEGVDLATLTTMGTPGVAHMVITPPDSETLGWLLRDLHETREPFILLGGGSNVIFTKRDVNPVILRLGKGFSFINNLSETTLHVGAATPLNQLMQHATRHCLTGLEWAVGIPGTVGGAVVGNAGAGGRGMGDHVVRVEGFSRDGTPCILSESDFHFTYRDSSLRDIIICAVQIKLKRGSRDEIIGGIKAFQDKRRGQPYGEHSPGCMFRNPPGNVAGRLIDEAGLKGFTVGHASVSPAHANFLISDGEASPEEVTALIEQVRDTVFKTTGIELQTEVVLIDPDNLEVPK